MSLVNDMLQDLDQRRRNVPGHSGGSESLVPVADSKARYGRPAALAALCVVVLVAIGAAALYLFVMPRQAEVPPASLMLEAEADLPAASATQSASEPVSSEVQAIAPASVSASGSEPVSAAPSTPLSAPFSSRQEQMVQAPATSPVSSQRSGSPFPDADTLADQPAANSNPGSSQAAGPGVDREVNRRANKETNEDSNEEALEADVSIPDPVESVADGSRAELASSLTALAPANAPETPPASSVRSTRELSFSDRERQLVQDALNHWSEGRNATALEQLSEFVSANQDAHRARETLAKLLFRQSSYERALAVAEEGLELAAAHAGYKKIKARIWLAAGRYDEVASLLISRAPTAAQDVEYYDLLATAYLSGRRYQDALSVYEQLIRQDNLQGRWWYGLALSHDALGAGSKALQAYSRAVALPDLSPGLRQRARQRIQQIQQ